MSNKKRPRRPASITLTRAETDLVGQVVGALVETGASATHVKRTLRTMVEHFASERRELAIVEKRVLRGASRAMRALLSDEGSYVSVGEIQRLVAKVDAAVA